IGFPVAGASPAGAKVFDRVKRDVGGGDFLPGSSRTVQEAQCDHQAVLNESQLRHQNRRVVRSSGCSLGAGVELLGGAVLLWRDSSAWFFCGGGLKRKKPLQGICPAGAV